MKIKVYSAFELEYQTDGAAGFDLRSTIDCGISPNRSVIIPTGLKIALPKGYEGQVRGRSGLNFKHSVVCPTGTIDSDYRGEIMVKLYNLGDKEFIVGSGDRIAQLIINKCERADFDYVTCSDFDGLETERGEKGFGSTGIN